jgi:hypothetical protein
MNLNCLNNIITENLSIYININDINSWNLNNDLTLNSTYKWNDAISDDLNLLDFGLTAFDNGRTDDMNNSLLLTQNDNKLALYRIGYNNESGNTYYTNYNITPMSGSTLGKYFSLNGGYLQGFFKLNEYNYEIFPPRYNNGITIETLIEILSGSSGIFYYMGTRSEDKYNPFFSGETEVLTSRTIYYGGEYTGNTYQFTGITTSEGHYLNSYIEESIKPNAFQRPELADTNILNNVEQVINIENNIIAFEITSSKKIKYLYINNNGVIIQNESPNEITRSGWTVIDIVFKPYDVIKDYDETYYLCYPRRKGDLIFYVNGRSFWKLKNFDEFYFKPINNDKEKQIGVPFNISWGGGSFGLKHSWHFSDFTESGITQDNSKKDLLIEKYFNSSFIGNIQKLRVYDNALSSTEVLHNAYIEATNNPNYNILFSKGGRIIIK